MVFTGVTIDKGCTMVSAFSICPEYFSRKGILEVYHHGFIKIKITHFFLIYSLSFSSSVCIFLYVPNIFIQGDFSNFRAVLLNIFLAKFDIYFFVFSDFQYLCERGGFDNISMSFLFILILFADRLSDFSFIFCFSLWWESYLLFYFY